MEEDVLKNHYLFSELNSDQWSMLKQSMRRIEMKDTEVLFEMGQPANRFYLVASGIIRLQRVSDSGDQKIINIMRTGQSFAEALMFHKLPTYPVTAVSVGNTVLYSFENEKLLAILRESVETCFQLMGHMSIRLHQFVRELDNLTLQNATYRLVNYLLRQVPPDISKDADVELDMPKHIIASHLSIKPETFSRMLHNMTKNGLISVKGNMIHIHDVNALRISVEQNI